MRSRLLLASTLVLTLLALLHPAWAWSNGGYSADANNPDYGTHDWIAERALDWLPANEKALILSYRAVYLYGTELPDNCQAVDKLCDTGKHHVYFRSSGTLQDNASARRALEVQSQVLSAIAAGDYASAAKWTGAMTHYISDLASFGHVMGAGTDWGAEPESVHGNYEDHVQTLMDEPGEAVISVSFDGMLSPTSAYDAALALARDTTFDLSGMGHTAVWMNQTNDWNSPVFTARAYQSINLAVNYVAEAVHAVWSGVTTTTTTQQVTTSTTQVQTTTTSTQQSPTTTSSVTTTRTTSTSTYSASTTSMTTSTTHQQTTTTITQQAGSFGMGFAFAVIGIGAGAAALGAGVAVTASAPLGSRIFAYGGYYYCRKHGVPVLLVNGRLWCPVEGNYLRS